MLHQPLLQEKAGLPPCPILFTRDFQLPVRYRTEIELTFVTKPWVLYHYQRETGVSLVQL